MFIRMVYSWNFPTIRFYFSFSCVANEIKDSQRVLPHFPQFINIVCYPWGDWCCPIWWGCLWCSPCPCLWGWCQWWGLTGLSGGGRRRRGDGVLVGALCRGRGRGAGVVDVEDLPSPEIECLQYLSSRGKCTHVLSALVLSTPGMTSQRLWMMDFLFLCSTPSRHLLWLHHVVRSLVGRW